MKTQDKTAFWSFAEQSNYETLFLDRDGSVIDRGPDGNPITDVSQIRFVPEFISSAAKLARHFRYIILFSSMPAGSRTPQAEAAQEAINRAIVSEVIKHGGDINGIYTDWESSPGTGISPLLLLKARRDFPAIYFARALMVGHDQADRLLAFNCGMMFHCTNPEEEINSLEDYHDIDSEINMLRKDIMDYFEVLTRFINSPVWINGIRLATRCCCHAIAAGKKVVVVFDKNTGFNADNFVANLNLISKGRRMLEHIHPVEASGVDETCRLLEQMCHPGDVAIGLSANGASDPMTESMITVQRIGVITISLTGAKPNPMDSSDVVIKVPTTDIGQVQGSFKLILAMIHKLVTHEMEHCHALSPHPAEEQKGAR